MIRLVNMHMPNVTNMAHSMVDMFATSATHENLNCATPSPDVIQRQGDALKIQNLSIAPVDWDHLFMAVQTRLENIVCEPLNHASASPLLDQKAKVKKVVLECVDELWHLHHSLMLERQSKLQR